MKSLIYKMDLASKIKKVNRIVIKIGSALLVDQETDRINKEWLTSLADDIGVLRRRNQDVVIVSSGAIALGRRQLGLPAGRLNLQESQAAAATGMVRLASVYQDVLGNQNLSIAQVLLTLDDSENRRRYINARNTLETLLKLNVVPLINENDTVATDEIRFGDNDRLAARVAAMVSADLLVLLSHVDGLYDVDPRKNSNAKHISLVENEITERIFAMAGSEISSDGSGGMVTKLEAARIAMSAGTHMIISDGVGHSPISRIESGAVCTWFVPQANPKTARKSWISSSLNPAGTVIVDKGALIALGKGKSLLPAGVISVNGRFERGDLITVKSLDGIEVARGLVAYSSVDAQRIIGHKTNEIGVILGYRGRDELIHRDDLVLS